MTLDSDVAQPFSRDLLPALPHDLAGHKPARLTFLFIVTSGSDMMQDTRDFQYAVTERFPSY